MVKLLLFSFWLMLYPVHVSFLSIDYLPEKKCLDAFLRVYFDDFLLDSGISNTGSETLKFTGRDGYTRNFIGRYLNEKVRISVNEKQLEGELRDINLTGNELTITVQYAPVNEVETVTIRNQIMTSLYSDMMNMLLIRIGSFEKGVRMTSAETEHSFRIK